VIGPVERIFGMGVAIVAISGHMGIVLFLQAAPGGLVSSRRAKYDLRLVGYQSPAYSRL
jgi:hypothetical protein